MSNRAIVQGLSALVVVAAVTNGIPFLAKRVGWLHRDAYATYWSRGCSTAGTSAGFLPLACCCTSQDDCSAPRTPPQATEARALTRYLYAVSPAELPLKLVKELVTAALIIVSVWFLWTGRSRFPSLATSWPALLVCALALSGAVRTAFSVDAGLAAAGARTFLFALVAVVSTWTARDLPLVAVCAAVLIGLNVLVMPLEFAYGLPMRFCPLPMRASGLHVSPNALGVFAVSSLALVNGLVDNMAARVGLAVGVVILLVLSGSGTGWVCLGLLAAATWAFGRSRRLTLTRGTLAAAGLITLILTLPLLTGRSDVWTSMFGQSGRLAEYRRAIENSSVSGLIFGNGLGWGAYGSMTFAEVGVGVDPTTAGSLLSESAVSSIYYQIGVLGLIACGVLLARAAWADRRLVPFYLVTGAASITAHVTEAFPLNIMLGLALSRSLQLDLQSRESP